MLSQSSAADAQKAFLVIFKYYDCQIFGPLWPARYVRTRRQTGRKRLKIRTARLEGPKLRAERTCIEHGWYGANRPVAAIQHLRAGLRCTLDGLATDRRFRQAARSPNWRVAQSVGRVTSVNRRSRERCRALSLTKPSSNHPLHHDARLNSL